MNVIRTHFFALLLLLTISSGFHTIGFFSDIERSLANVFSATLLDHDVAGEPLEGLLCNQVDRVDTVLYSGNIGPIPLEYSFEVLNAGGTLCSGLDARLLNDESGMLYDGPLLGLQAGGIGLPEGSTDELFLELRLAGGVTEVGSCAFDTGWFAMQIDEPGFSDVEIISHLVSGSGIGVGAGCIATSTVNLHLSKAISGETLGYELSDFAYRVIGNGLDVIVPHDHTVPLPEGTYVIEELVPDDFVKEDWRIGWYGECERGDTFFTTITIDDGNIDHGTLYCQADNQYRPDQRARVRSDRSDNDHQSHQAAHQAQITATTSATSSATAEATDGADGADGVGEGSAGASINVVAPGTDATLVEFATAASELVTTPEATELPEENGDTPEVVAEESEIENDPAPEIEPPTESDEVVEDVTEPPAEPDPVPADTDPESIEA